MATAAEATFWQAVVNANGVKQASYASAFATYLAAGFSPAARTTYVAAALAADVAFVTACNSAASTANITPNVVPFFRSGFGPSISATIAS